MDIKLKLVEKEKKNILKNLIEEYQKEILKQDSVEPYKYLDSYWEKIDSYPYFIEDGENILGFVLVNSHTVIEEKAKSISEFYIKKEFRKKGVGKRAAFEIFKLFPGKWEIRQIRENTPAQKFWRKIIGEYTQGVFKEYEVDNDKWVGYIQTFDNSNLAA